MRGLALPPSPGSKPTTRDQAVTGSTAVAGASRWSLRLSVGAATRRPDVSADFNPPKILLVPRPPHFVFACGGSLGNLYPGLSIARQLKTRFPEARITFVGDGGATERQTARGAGYNYAAIPCKPRPKRAAEALRFVTDNTLGLIASRWFLSENRASLVVGLGGHATAPLLRAAMTCGLPTVLLEQNAMPSRTSRWLATRADAVLLGFNEARPRLPLSARTRFTGTPARPSFESLRLPLRKDQRNVAREKRRLVIIGGVGGARSLNVCAPAALASLSGSLENWRVVHQSGDGQLIDTERRYRRQGVEAVVVSFIDEMADLLRENRSRRVSCGWVHTGRARQNRCAGDRRSRFSQTGISSSSRTPALCKAPAPAACSTSVEEISRSRSPRRSNRS